MATLILQQNGIRCGGVLNDSLYIGRRPANSLVILDPSVSRLHAWIGRKDGEYFIADTASRTGTFVNQERVTARQPLRDGDRIRIGPTEMLFRADDHLPSMIQLMKFGPSPNTDTGLFFECACGQLMWASSSLAGRSAHCASCGATLHIPGRPTAAAGKVRADPGKSVDAIPMCSVCQTPIAGDDAKQVCPDCGLKFHRQCWEENRGCSSYGCSQANVLGEAGAETSPDDAAPRLAEDRPAIGAARALPWEYLLLAGSALSIPIGALLFGVPGLFMTAASAMSLRRPSRRGVVVLALALGIVATILGLGISWFWWAPDSVV